MLTYHGGGCIEADEAEVPRPLGYRALQGMTVVASNIAAVEAGIKFLRGDSPFVVLHGPSGWGKSQLVLGIEAEGIERGLRIRVRDAVNWAAAPSRTDHNCVLILEDVQGLARHPRLRHSLRLLLAQRARARRATMLVGTSEYCPTISKLLPSASRPWKFVSIEPPCDSEKLAIVRSLASGMDLQLSDEVGMLIARHLRGNGRSLIGALERLKLMRQEWSQPSDVLLACGVLRPYWLGSGGWDARDTVADAVAFTCGGAHCEDAMNRTIAYFLLDELGLTEHESASFLKVREATVYRWAEDVKRSLEDGSASCPVDACRNAIICALRAS
ncbi:MAG: hypothetical protein IT207_09820 [Fimbriimonadaceae bacterium]|nr:hypothetical protein [Fimbriimonadaceae bacterium]